MLKVILIIINILYVNICIGYTQTIKSSEIYNNKIGLNGEITYKFIDNENEIYFIANIFDKDIYTFIYTVNDKINIKFYFQLIEKNRFYIIKIINIESQNYLECNNIKAYILPNEIELEFNCKKWNYKNIFLKNESKNED
jgi:hypothetical protein